MIDKGSAQRTTGLKNSPVIWTPVYETWVVSCAGSHPTVNGSVVP